MIAVFSDGGRDPDTDPPAAVSLHFAGSAPTPAGPHRGWRPALLVVVLVGLLLVCLTWWWSSRPGRMPASVQPTPLGSAAGAGPGAAAPPTAADLRGVLTLLHRLSDAVSARDAAAWSAQLDPSAPAAAFARRERVAFSGLQQLPVAHWSYALVAPVTDPGLITPAAGRLGARVVLVHVRLSYQLAGVDPAPSAKDLWLTATDRPTGWRLAGDSDADTAEVRSWRGPWDFGPLAVQRGAHTLVIAHPAQRGDLASFAGLVDGSIPAVSSVWGTAWNQHIAVLIPATAAEFAADTGVSTATGDIAAIAVADAVRDDRLVLGARIVINPDTVRRLDAAGRRLVVQHELTHIATRASTADAMPVWVVEGFADYVGHLGSRQPLAAAAPELAADVRAGRVPAALPTDAQFAGTDQALPQAYEQAWLACRLIAQRAGNAGLVRFYRQVDADTRAHGAAAAVPGALQTVLHTGLARFTADWRTALTRGLR